MEQTFTFVGIVTDISQPQIWENPQTGNSRKYQRITCEEGDKFKSYPEFEFSGNNCDKLNDIRIGDEVAIKFRLNGKKYTSQNGNSGIINSLSAWNIVLIQSVAQSNVNQDTVEIFPPKNEKETSYPIQEPMQSSSDDDLPF